MRGVHPTEETTWDDDVREQSDIINAMTNMMNMIRTIKTK
jgi:hypothetical protein